MSANIGEPTAEIEREGNVNQKPPTDDAGPALATASVRVTQARVGLAWRRAWSAFARRPIEHIAGYLVFLTATAILPVLGNVFRIEAFGAGLGRLAGGEPLLLSELIIPEKTRESYALGFWRLVWNVIRTDLTVLVLFVMLAVFAALPAAILFPINSELVKAISAVAPLLSLGAWLPLAFLCLVTVGALAVAFVTYARLLARVPATRLSSSMQLALVTRAAGAMRTHLGFTLKAVLIPAAAYLAFALVFGGLFALAGLALPLGGSFLVTALGVPAGLVFAGWLCAFIYQVAETLAATVPEAEIALHEGVSLSARFAGFFIRLGQSLFASGQTSALVMVTFSAFILLLVGALLRSPDQVSAAYLGLFAVVAASFTALAALNSRKGGQS